MPKKTKSVLAWHWVADTLRDGSPIPKDGETLVHPRKPVMCREGFHGSRRILHALKYAPGHTVCRTLHTGVIIDGNDKLVSSERTVLWRVDAKDILQRYARMCALDVVHLWECPDIVLRFLKTGDESLRAAARDAARATASAAAWDAAWDAAWAAARAAARATARDAAWDAASAAARDAARDAASAAARDAAWDAARDAARDKQNRRLTFMVCYKVRYEEEPG